MTSSPQVESQTETQPPTEAHPEPQAQAQAQARTAPSPAAPPAHPLRGQGPAALAVSVGGGLGAAARYGAGLLWPALPGSFPWTTLGINALGCALIGVLMVLVTEHPAGPPHPLLRPFVGTGVLGGFTTFSTYAIDVERLVGGGHAGTALAYLAATAVAALLSVWAATALTRRLCLCLPEVRTP